MEMTSINLRLVNLTWVKLILSTVFLSEAHLTYKITFLDIFIYFYYNFFFFSKFFLLVLSEIYPFSDSPTAIPALSIQVLFLKKKFHVRNMEGNKNE